MIACMGQMVLLHVLLNVLRARKSEAILSLFIIVLTPQPPLSGGLRRRRLVGLWYSKFPPDKEPALSCPEFIEGSSKDVEGGQGGYLPSNEDSKIIWVSVLSVDEGVEPGGFRAARLAVRLPADRIRCPCLTASPSEPVCGSGLL